MRHKYRLINLLKNFIHIMENVFHLLKISHLETRNSKVHEKFQIEIQENLIAAKKQNKEKLKNTDTTFSYHCAFFFLTLSSQTGLVFFFQKIASCLMPLEAQGFELATQSIKRKKNQVFPTHPKSINIWEGTSSFLLQP